MAEITVLDGNGRPVQVDPHEYAQKIGHEVTIDEGGSTVVYHEDGSVEKFYPSEEQ